MKTLYLAISVFAACTFLSAPSWALMGTNDNVPGYDILLPFFLVSAPGQGSMDTIVVITETNVFGSSLTFHFILYNKDGRVMADGSIPMTRGDVEALSIQDIIDNYVADAEKEYLKVNLDGNDYYAGYMVFENSNIANPKNHVVAKAYVLDLFTRGISAATNLPVREVDESLRITDNKIVSPTRHTEYFSPNALYRAQEYIEQQPVIGDATYFRILPRYYLHDSNSVNYWFIWAGKPCPQLHINIFEADGYSVSGSLPALSAGLNILSVKDFLPPMFLQTFPASGWAEIRMPDIFGGDQFDGEREMLGYSFGFKDVSPIMCGDTNVNGRVDIGDAMFIAQYLVGSRDILCGGDASMSPGVTFLTPMARDAGAAN